MRYPAFIEADFEFPEFHYVRMNYSREALADVAGAVGREIDALLPASGIRPGDRVAVGVGSRGIDRLETIVRTSLRAAAAGGRPAGDHPGHGQPRRRHGRGPARPSCDG